MIRNVMPCWNKKSIQNRRIICISVSTFIKVNETINNLNNVNENLF